MKGEGALHLFFHPLALQTWAAEWGRTHGPGLMPKAHVWRGVESLALQAGIPPGEWPHICPESTGLLAILEGLSGNADSPGVRVRQARAMWQFFNRLGRFGLTMAQVQAAVPPSLAPHWQAETRRLQRAEDALARRLASQGLTTPGKAEESTFRRAAEAWAQTPPAAVLTGLEHRLLTPAEAALHTCLQSNPATQSTPWQGTHATPHSPPEITLLTSPTPAAEAEAVAATARHLLAEGPHPVCIITEDAALAAHISHKLAAWGLVPYQPSGQKLAETQTGRWWLALAAALEDPSALAMAALLGQSNGPNREAFWALESLFWRGPNRGTSWAEWAENWAAWQAEVQSSPPDPAIPAARFTWAQEGWAHLAAFWPALQTPAPWATWVARFQTTAQTLGAPPPESPGSAHVANLLTQGQTEPSPLHLTPAEAGALLADALHHLRLRQEEWTENLMLTGVPEGVALAAPTRILAGMVEGTWPRLTPDPWLTDDQLGRLGLPTRAVQTQQAEQAFHTLANLPGRVVLSRATRNAKGEDLRPSRFWQAITRRTPQAAAEATQRGLAFLNLLPPPPEPLTRSPSQPPAWVPSPGSTAFTWSARYVENLANCPYRAWADKHYRWQPLLPFEAPPNPTTTGLLLHKWLETALQTAGGTFTEATLRTQGEALLATQSPLTRAVVGQRMHNLIPHLVEQGAALVAEGFQPAKVEDWLSATVNGQKITARTDAVWQQPRTPGSPHPSAIIIDYKSGTPPTWKDVATGRKPQLALQGAMLRQAGHQVADLAYWQLKGSGAEPFKAARATSSKVGLANLLAPVEGSVARFSQTFTAGKPFPATPSEGTDDNPGFCGTCALAGVCRKKEWQTR